MKGKSKRTQIDHIVDNSRKVERSTQKSMRRENSHYLKNSWFTFAGIAGVFRSIMMFLFNNTSGSEYRMPTFEPVLPELIRRNNSDKRWYKTHVPKSMRAGLTTSEVLTLRKKIYHSKEIYV